MTKRFVFLGLPVLLLTACTGSRTVVQSGASTSRLDYIEKYKDLAVREMERTGVPASITMAQALLESNDGNSTLARKANNHFGIKCHKDWSGPRIHHDDDARGECFRKYSSVYDSYRDHSDFLRAGSRYNFLFELDVQDYKSWARGLKTAGYATNKSYDDMLIRIIEDNQLFLLDRGVRVQYARTEKERNESQTILPEREVANDYEFSVSLASREIRKNNRIDYVISREGDSYASLAKEFNLMPWEIYRYNEIPRTTGLEEGQIVYLQPKRNQAEAGTEVHKVKEGESMYFISQKYGIRLARLYQINGMEEGEEPSPGTELILRGTAFGKP